MPDKEIILARTSQLPIVKPPVETGVEYRDDQIWEDNEGGAHFKVTKERLPFPILPPVYALSVSGRRRAIEKVISDFEQALGKPLTHDTDPNLPGIHFVLWNATAIDK